MVYVYLFFIRFRFDSPSEASYFCWKLSRLFFKHYGYAEIHNELIYDGCWESYPLAVCIVHP